MDATEATAEGGTVRTSWLPRAGAVAALLLATGYVAMMPLFASVGAPPTGAEARVAYHVAGTTAWWGIVGLSILTDLLFVPVAVALYAGLRRTDQATMLLATTFTMLFVVLDLAVLWPAKVSMITLGERYAAATSDEARGLILAAAGYPAAVLDSGLTPVYSILTLGIGIALTGMVMLRGRFGRATAVVGIVTGVLGIASVAETAVTGAFPVLVVAASLSTIIWLVLVARGLWRGSAGSSVARVSRRATGAGRPPSSAAVRSAHPQG